ncbi:MAG TPA: thiolase family protein [Micavibrio sp.]|jgi:acetyl-CoA acyltransferase
MQDCAVIIDTVRTPFTRAVAPVAVDQVRSVLPSLIANVAKETGLDHGQVEKIVMDWHAGWCADNAPDASGKAPGKLAHVDPIDMAALLTNNIIQRTGINPADVENVILGCTHQEAEQGLNPGRMVVLHKGSGLPNTVQGDSVDKFCASSARAISIARGDILAGDGHLILAGGVQSMSRVPMGGWNGLVNSNVYSGHVKSFMNMGVTAENLAKIYNISREAQDRFALDSHSKTAAAQAAGYFNNEIIPVGAVNADDNVRTDSTMEKLAKLKPSFKAGGSVTPATSSPFTDGASMVLMAPEAYARANNLPILARIVAYAGSGCAPEIMGIGPVSACEKVLKRAGLTMNDIDFIELNEAFAAQSLAVLEELDNRGMHVAPEKLNIHGGAIALGHPLAATAARQAGHLARVLQWTGKRYGLYTQCVGQGQATATIIENPDHGHPKPTL